MAVAFGAGIDVAIDPDAVVPGPWREALPRIVREAVAAAARHGGARHVSVELRDAGGVRLRISDDGDAARPLPVGLMERAESLGGRCSVAPGPDGGITVEVLLPALKA